MWSLWGLRDPLRACWWLFRMRGLGGMSSLIDTLGNALELKVSDIKT